jgi:single-stranded-DNA-specific exonuclease
MEKVWISQKTSNESIVTQLSNELNVAPIITRLLTQRGVETFEAAHQFFRPNLNNLHDPFLMADMHAAVNRLSGALHNQENILVYGDYDVDGTTAVTLVYSFLKKIGGSCFFYIPDRYTEGYGFSFKGVDFARENNCTLIITLDCGVRRHCV